MGKHLVFVGGGHAHLTAPRAAEGVYPARTQGHPHQPLALPVLFRDGPGNALRDLSPPGGSLPCPQTGRRSRGGIPRRLRDRLPPPGAGSFPEVGRKIPYDVVSFNTGSEVPAEKFLAERSENIFPVKPVIHFLSGRRFILDAPPKTLKRFLVAAGAPAGVELTANLSRLLEEKERRRKNHSDRRNEAAFRISGEGQSPGLKFFPERGIEVLEGAHAKEFTETG